MDVRHQSTVWGDLPNLLLNLSEKEPSDSAGSTLAVKSSQQDFCLLDLFSSQLFTDSGLKSDLNEDNGSFSIATDESKILNTFYIRIFF